jgi:hypothetical protein
VPRRVKKQADWSRPLTPPLHLGRGKGVLRTLQDVGTYLLRMSPQQQAQARWHNVAEAALEAAVDGDVGKVSHAFKQARTLGR